LSEDQDYIYKTWQIKKDRVIYYYTKFYPNLGSTSSQRGESYHSIMREIINGQLLIKELVKYLISKTLSILKNIIINKNLFIRKYIYTTQLIIKDIAF